MSTVSDLITDAIAAIGEGGIGTNLSAADAGVALRELRRMLGTWANDGLMVYATSERSFDTVAGEAAYSTSLISTQTETVNPDNSVTTNPAAATDGRPASIQNIFVRQSDTDYPLSSITEPAYDALAYKPATGLPAYYFYKPTFPNGTFYFYPTPDQAYTVHIKGRYELMDPLTLSTGISLPPGYEDAIVSSLGIRLCPYFGLRPTQELLAASRAAKYWLQTVNYQPIEMSPLTSDNGLPSNIRIQSDI